MNNKKLKKYNNSQLFEILSFKWTESEKAGQDLYPGEDGVNKAAFDWINKYSISYREFWIHNYKDCE